jgi:hypothetical protein
LTSNSQLGKQMWHHHPVLISHLKNHPLPQKGFRSIPHTKHGVQTEWLGCLKVADRSFSIFRPCVVFVLIKLLRHLFLLEAHIEFSFDFYPFLDFGILIPTRESFLFQA